MKPQLFIIINIGFYCVQGNHIFAAAFLHGMMVAATFVGLVREPMEEHSRSRIADSTSPQPLLKTCRYYRAAFQWILYTEAGEKSIGLLKCLQVNT